MKMIKYSADMPSAQITGSQIDEHLYPPLDGVPFAAHRLVDGEQIDARTAAIFYIDSLGDKHLIPGGDRQELACSFNDELRPDGDGLWRVATDDDAVDDIISAAETSIDRICDAVYTQSPSRNARYRQKLAEAVRYIEAGSPGTVATADYPYLVREASKRGETKNALAELIISRSTSFNELGSEAEAARAELQNVGLQPDPQAAADDIVNRIRTIATTMEA